MLGQTTASGASSARQVPPAGERRARAIRVKAQRKLESRIGQAAALLFEGRGRERPFEGGSVLARRDEAGNDVFIVLRGIVGLYQDRPSGGRVLGYCGGGDLVAPAAPGKAWGFDAKALSDGELLALSLREVRTPETGKPDLLWPLFEAACAELARRTDRLRGYWALPVKARLAAFLFEMEEIIGETSEGVLILHLPMFRDEIADYLVTRTETICRILTGWKERGLIVMESPRIVVIPDSARLWAAASE